MPAEVWVDERLAGEAPGSLSVGAGRHELELRAPGFVPQRTAVRLEPGQELAIAFELIEMQGPGPIAGPTGLQPTLFWIGVGATAATAVAGGFFALRALSLHDDALQLPVVHPDRAQKRGDVEDAEITADVFFASAALLAIGTTVVFFATDWDAATRMRPDEELEPRIRLAPAIAPDTAGLALGGRL